MEDEARAEAARARRLNAASERARKSLRLPRRAEQSYPPAGYGPNLREPDGSQSWRSQGSHLRGEDASRMDDAREGESPRDPRDPRPGGA